MESDKSEIQKHQTSVEMVLAPSDEVYAGLDVILQTKVLCSENCDSLEGYISILDQEGAVITNIELNAFGEEGYLTDEFIMEIPVETGSYTWTAAFFPPEDGEVLHEESSVPFTFVVIPHSISMSVWGAPLPANQGEEFTVKVGAKCSAGCQLAGLSFSIHRDSDDHVTTGILGDDPLPQTSGVFWTEQSLVAPEEEGLTTWVVECDESEQELPHQVISSSFKLNTVSLPDKTITVEVFDVRRGVPLKGAEVYVHPYRSTTDEQGLANLQITAGNHKLFVKLQDYTDFQTTLEVSGDVEVKAPMMYAPDPFA